MDLRNYGQRAAALPPAVLLLAEHLDAILALGEDLMAMDFDLTSLSHPGAIAEERRLPASLGQFIARVRTFEGLLLLRLDRARESAGRLMADDERFLMPLRLFMAGTVGLTDSLRSIAEECAGRCEDAFCPIVFMRRRGLAGEECGSFTGLMTLELDEAYLVAGAFPLGVIMDHAATLLDVLDIHYDLFPEANERADGVSTPPQSNTAGEATAGGRPLA